MTVISKTIKVKVIKEFKVLEEILPLGFETELNILVTSEEKIIPAVQTYIGRYAHESQRGPFIPEQIVPIGNYDGFNFKGINNEVYDESCLQGMIGYHSLGEIFIKI